jgi:hypothetical protein
MFYQNSNDLVKNATMKTGHVQNSNATQQEIIQQVHPINGNSNSNSNSNMVNGDHGGGGGGGARGTDTHSLSIGAQFQNAIQNIFGSITSGGSSSNTDIIEGIQGNNAAPTVANPGSGPIGGNGDGDMTQLASSTVNEDKAYVEQENTHRRKVAAVDKLLTLENKQRLGEWAKIIDTAGVSKHGYITKDRIFQIWLEKEPKNWFETLNMKQNSGVLGCPVASGNLKKIEIGVNWDAIKPFTMVYAKNDNSLTTPLFMLTNDGVRDIKRSKEESGLFSCGNERTNVFVTERPSADFDNSAKTNRQGCYIVNTNVKDQTFKDRGFTYQEDLFEASISQCKRRAEDLGSSYFLVSESASGKHPNKGGCWVYTGSGEPNLNGLLTYDEGATKCNNANEVEGDEDGFMKSYGPTILPRLYGNSRPVKSMALYSLKVGGPTGVDSMNQNGRGYVGRIAYIDHNGERHDYPESALSYIRSGEKDKDKLEYVNIGAYDTRSSESSYSLKEITPGSFSDATNLLYKASRDGWSQHTFHQKCDDKGATYTRAVINDGRVLGAYTSVSWSSNVQNYKGDTTAFLYDGSEKYTPNNGHWGAGNYDTYMNSAYYPTFGGGHDFYMNGQTLYNNAYTFLTNNRNAPFGRSMYSYQSYTLSDLEVYAVDATIFPNTLDYAKRSRTMPVGEVMTASFDKCREMCDGDDKCGGFVYTKGSGGADGKCELKDKAKMYPVGLRVADPTKQLMLKVPTVNGSISDTACGSKADVNGEGKAYNLIDSGQYMYYPDGGVMSSNTKCKVSSLIPKVGNLQPVNVNPLVNAVDKQFSTTNTAIFDYGAQTAVPGVTFNQSPETFINFREGLSIETDISAVASTYGSTMSGVGATLKKIGNAQYQRERLDAIKDESSKLLISESYKFILWSILAILAVMALLKLKEMFGQEDIGDGDGGGGGGGGGGILGFITSLLGLGSVKLNDVADRTGDMKAALSNAGDTLKQTGENLVTGITEGADTLVNSVNDAANNAVDGAKNIAGQVSETATNAVNSIGETASAAVTSSTTPASAPTSSIFNGPGGGAQNNVKTGGRSSPKALRRK